MFRRTLIFGDRGNDPNRGARDHWRATGSSTVVAQSLPPGVPKAIMDPQGEVPAAQDDERDLREKVRSKIDVAKVLGGAITLTLGWVLTSSEFDKTKAVTQLAIVALIVSLALYLSTVDSYDSLLMPSRFWSFDPRADAPSLIHREMVRVWMGLFLPATGTLLLGLLLLVVSVVSPGWLIGVAMAAGAATVVSLNLRFRPRLLASDRRASDGRPLEDPPSEQGAGATMPRMDRCPCASRGRR
jgi:hypothetical protein